MQLELGEVIDKELSLWEMVWQEAPLFRRTLSAANRFKSTFHHARELYKHSRGIETDKRGRSVLEENLYYQRDYTRKKVL